MGEPTQRCVAHHGQQAQRGDRTNEEEAQADQGEGGGEPLILVALRGLVELAGGQDPAGQGDRRPGGQVAAEDRSPVEGTPVGVGNTHGRQGEVDSQHGA